MGIPATQIRKGMVLDVDGGLFKVHEFTHVTPGKGQAVMQTKLRNLRTGAMIERRFRSAETVEKAHLDQRSMQYVYKEGDLYAFMDLETYEQVHLTEDQLGDALPFLTESMEAKVSFVDEEALGVEIAGTVDMTVAETEPAIKGATASAQTKAATTSTGLVVQVPPFIAEGDTIRIDTTTGAYLTRVT